ncbi:MAG TPA: hypothetical protein DCM64_12640 [Gammaproteobacteria bacterium]|nr:hypothetical protein [Gammaproteobacteria bacterium]
MKILLLNNAHLPLIGGKEIVVYHLATSLLELGHEVLLVGPAGWYRFIKHTFGYTLYRWHRISLVPKELAWKIHKVEEIGFGARLDPEKDKKICFAVQNAIYTTAISKAVAASLEDASTKKNIISIPNGVDIKRFTQKVDVDVFKHFELPHDSKLIVSVGNYHVRKGHKELVDGFLKALEVDPKLRLIIVGNTSAPFCNSVIERGLGDYVKFSGVLRFPLPGYTSTEPDLLVTLLHASYAYVSSSIAEGTEGLSLAMLEAMAAGSCVIATSISGNEDIINSEENGILVAPGSIDELTAALLRIASDDTTRNRLAQNGQETVEQFLWLSITQKYLELYKLALSQDSR